MQKPRTLLSSKMHPLSTLPHNNAYIVDRNIVNSQIPGWQTWVNQQSKELWIPSVTSVPSGYKILDTQPLHKDKFESVFDELIKLNNIEDRRVEGIKSDFEIMLACCYQLENLSQNASVVFATCNHHLVRRLLQTENKRRMLDEILKVNGLPTIMPVRLITKQSNWKEF